MPHPDDRNDDYDDRPPPRRRRDEWDDSDDDYDDRPRRRRRPAGSGKFPWLLVIGIVVVVFIVMAVPIALLLPAVSKVRNAATRAKDANSMRQIGLAMHAEHDRYGGVFAPFAHEEQTSRLTGSELSARVSRLPYLEQQSLYRQFDLRQGWDSPRNRSASDTTVATYQSPFDVGDQQLANTPYRSFVGGGAMFSEDGKPVPLTTVTDGMANTIMMVNGVESVPWAAPRELRYDPAGPIPAFWRKDIGGTNVLMADGSVRFIRDHVPETTLRLLITKADGQPIPGDF
jgi:prepilin-type processing-associated H-X9-DG protein